MIGFTSSVLVYTIIYLTRLLYCFKLIYSVIKYISLIF